MPCFGAVSRIHGFKIFKRSFKLIPLDQRDFLIVMVSNCRSSPECCDPGHGDADNCDASSFGGSAGGFARASFTKAKGLESV